MFVLLATAAPTANVASVNIATKELLSGVLTREVAYAAVASFAAVAAAVHDLNTRRIPNLLAVTALFCGLALHVLLGGLGELGRSALAGLAAGVLFFVFYLAGGMGAGDVKLMAAVGCLAGCRQLPLLLMLIVLCGALVAVAIALRHGMLRQTLVRTWMLAGHHRAQGLMAHPEWNAANASALRMPFAVPIAAGCAVSLAAQLFKAWPGKG